MKKYTIFHAFFMGFYSKSFYRSVVKNWRGTGIAYLFLLVALCSIATTYRVVMSFEEVTRYALLPFIDQLPKMTFTDGKLSIDKPSPYFIKNADNETVAIIDTSGKYHELSNTGDAVLLLTDKAVLYRTDKLKIRRYELKDLLYNSTLPNYFMSESHMQQAVENARKVRFSNSPQTIVITPASLKAALTKLDHYASVYGYLVSTVVQFIYRFVQVLLYAFIGFLFTALLRVTLDYKTLLRLTIATMTPVIILNTVADFFVLLHPHKIVLFFLLAMVYLFFGVYSNSRFSQGSEAS